MDRIANWLKQYDTPVNNKSFALFRITFALFLLVFIDHITFYRPLIFNTIPKLAMNPFPAKLFISIWALSVAALLLGVFTRTAAVINYLIVVVTTFTFSNSGSGSFNDDLLRIGSFLLIFMPVSKQLSIDALISQVRFGTKPSVYTSRLHYTGAIFISLGLLYWASSITKLFSPMWQSGLGLWIPAVMPYNKWHSFTFYLNMKWLLVSLNYLTVIWEFLFPFVLLSKRWSAWFAIIGVAFHLCIALIFPFPLLCFGPIPFYLLFIGNKFWKQRGTPATMAIQEGHKRQLVLSRLAQGLNPQLQVEFHQSAIITINQNHYTSNWEAAHVLLRQSLGGQIIRLPLATGIGRILATYVCDDLIQVSSKPIVPLTILPYAFKRQALAIFCTLLLGVQTFYSAYHLHSRLNGGFTMEGMLKYYHIRKDINDFSLKPSNLFRTLFGLNARGVFLDHSNRGTKTVFAIVHRSADGRTRWLPFFNEKGYCLNQNMNLAWSKYTFNSVCCGTIPNPHELEKTLWFWAQKGRINLDSLDLYVVKRTYTFPEHFVPDYHQQLISLPWQEEGTVHYRKGVFSYTPADSLTPR